MYRVLDEALEVMHLLVNFGFQMVLVGQDVLVPFGDGLLLTHPDLLSHLEKEKNNYPLCHKDCS